MGKLEYHQKMIRYHEERLKISKNPEYHRDMIKYHEKRIEEIDPI